MSEWTQTDMNYLNNCVFIDEAGFDISIRPEYGRAASGSSVVIVTPSTRAETHTILGTISFLGVVNIEVRIPQKPKKIKADGSRKRKSTKPKEIRQTDKFPQILQTKFEL
jgi:hypothetical protein